MVGLVERLCGGVAVEFSFLFGVLGGCRLGGQRRAVFDQERLQVRARVGVQRVQDLVELYRVRGLRDGDRVAG